MELTGNLKKQADEAADNTEKEKLIEKESIELTDNELDMVAGGVKHFQCPYDSRCPNLYPYSTPCTRCAYNN